jgi:hypothetical protein
MGEGGRRSKRARRGAFTFLWPVPQGGFRWDDELAPAPLFGAREPDAASSASGPWLVDPVPVGGRDEGPSPSCAPLNVPGLHRRFASTKPRRADILKFANKYGSLGRPVGLIDPRVHTPQMMFQGEHLDLWHRELARMAQLVEIWDLTKDPGGAGKLGQIVKWRESPPGVYLNWGREPESPRIFPDGRLRDVRTDEPEEYHLIATDGEPGIEESLLRGWRFGEDVVAPARYYVHRQVNRAMAGHVSPAVLPFLKGEFVLWPDDLLSALYVSFALELSGQSPAPRVCGYCGRFFHPTRVDQRYCESRCRNNRSYNKLKGGNKKPGHA